MTGRFRAVIVECDMVFLCAERLRLCGKCPLLGLSKRRRLTEFAVDIPMV